MKLNELSIVVGVSRGFWENLRLTLATIPRDIPVIVSWYGAGEPSTVPPNVLIVRPWRHTDNYMRGYVLNVAIRAVSTTYVLISDADFLFPRALFSGLPLWNDAVLRFYVGDLTPQATATIRGGMPWEEMLADYQGLDDRVFFKIWGGHNPCVYPTKLLHRLRGYDERMKGWGAEDDDLTIRTRRAGIKELRVPVIVAHLFHGDSPDYRDTYRRRKTSPRNLEILDDPKRPAAANPDGWGDAD